ncbi:PREDICTED: aquaporin-4-like isoform X1 [Nanorana parkeri]|uniref:aquaporin-4-like isoform X1 n=1 Tax=Nanorana parkeri TaxID=125878 RepID=UPI0008541FC7|nr:PREDICTED: aquaporin-4-like isoform X1 [Nanorana parkeri]
MVAFKGVWTQSFWKAVSAEFLGTLIFVLLGLGSTISWTSADSSQPADLVLISLCFGYGIVTMVHCFGHISGAHINPAVTIALVCTRKLTLAKSVFYIIAQCLGAILGAGLLYLITPNDISGNLGVTMINERLSIGHGLLIELIITFQLVFTISASCDPKNKDRLPALAIGISVVFGHLFAIYCIVPIIGAICAGAAYNYIYCPDADFKQHLKEALKKAKQKTNGKYIEVGDNRSQVDTDDLILKSGTIHVIDIEQGEGKKGKDSASEILSTV